MTDTAQGATAQLRRFLALEDILIGHPDGIDGPRLAAGLTWARHGSTTADRESLIGLFASRWQAAQDEGEWDGDAMAEGEKDLDEVTAAALSVPSPVPGDREAVARIVDPWAFGIVANIQHTERAADDREKALAKADAILAVRWPAAVADIAAERQRQIDVEGWTLEHDRAHEDGNLAAAAGCYALNAAGELQPNDFCYDGAGSPASPVQWPWDSEWWKPKDARRDLVRAGSLIVAEIERLDRAALKEGGA